jgi:hypothetical protein
VGGGQNAWPDVAISKRDYQGNIQATDRGYASLGQVHPAIEYPQNPAVSSVAYIRGSTINLVVRWRNDNPFPLSGTLTWQAARLVCPTNDPPLEYLPLNPECFATADLSGRVWRRARVSDNAYGRT